MVKNLIPGHTYELPNFEKPEVEGQKLQFIHKEPVEVGSTELKTVNDGTTNEAVIEVLLDRMNFLNEKFPCKENKKAIKHLKKSLKWLEARTKGRVKRGVEGKQEK